MGLTAIFPAPVARGVHSRLAMRAIYYDDYGDASVLKLGEQPTPKVGKGDILVRVAATSVNPVDWKVRQGELKVMSAFRFPIIPGRDVAGTVAEVGADAGAFKPGDRVFGMTDGVGGASAEFAVLPASVAVAIPPGLSDADAAAVPLVGLTALQALRDHGELKAGERVLVNGASGGVGLMAVQIAKAMGAAEVVGVASASHFDVIRSLGVVDRLIDHKSEDFTTARDAYDVVFDAAGKSSYAAAKPTLRHDGRYVTTLPDAANAVGYVSSLFTEKKARPFMAKDRGEDLVQLAAWLAAGRLRPTVGKTFPLAELAAAQTASEHGEVVGKIVVLVG